MIMNIETIISIAGTVLGTFGLVFALLAFRAVRRGRARWTVTENSLSALRRELELAASKAIKTRHRVKRIAERYSGLNARVDQLELRGSAQGFDQAIDAARRGADTSKLTHQFGLNRSEADLVARLHGRTTSA